MWQERLWRLSRSSKHRPSIASIAKWTNGSNNWSVAGFISRPPMPAAAGECLPALGNRPRKRLLEHPTLRGGPIVLLEQEFANILILHTSPPKADANFNLVTGAKGGHHFNNFRYVRASFVNKEGSVGVEGH